MRFPLLLASNTLSLDQRWTLVSSLFDQVRSLLEGSIALLVTLLVGGLYTGWWGFAGLAGLTLVVTLVRLLQWRHFVRARRTNRGARPPEAWALDYTIGICVMASLWAATVVTVSFRFHDLQLLLFTLLVQNAWLAGVGVRNAASPSAILAQTLCAVVPTIICLAFGNGVLVRLLSPACVIFILILLKIARIYGNQMLSLMESEQRLAASNAQLLTLSCTDGLTGIPNRRAFDERLAVDWAHAVRERLELALVILDVDHFKRYNDLYGHLAGDDCLRAVGRHVAEGVRRESDLSARYGGEEFVLLLPGSRSEGALAVAERLRRAVQDANLPHAGSSLGQVTISLGIASLVPEPLDLPAKLITLADQALYQAKKAGRNQCRVATRPPPAHSAAQLVEACPASLPLTL